MLYKVTFLKCHRGVNKSCQDFFFQFQFWQRQYYVKGVIQYFNILIVPPFAHVIFGMYYACNENM